MKNYIFDLYGTLADIRTDENSEKFTGAMCRYFAMPDFPERYASLCKNLETGEEFCEIQLIKVFEELASGNAQKAAAHFRKKSRSKLKLYAGIRSFLKKLKARGAKLFILSNAQSCFTLNELDKLKITGLFDGIELSSDFGKKKPSSEFFEHILQKYALERAETIFIGNDFHSDVLGAKAVGLKTAYIKSNCSPQDDSLELVSKTSDFSTDNFKDLARYLLSI